MKTLDYCVAQVQNDREDFSPRGYQKYLQYAINTYRTHLAFSLDTSIEVMYGVPNALGIVDMPTDYEYYTKVAVLVGGKYVTLTRNDNIALNRRTDSCGDEVFEDEHFGEFDNFTNIANYPFAYGFLFASHYRAGNYVGEMYGMGGGINRDGYFTEDTKLRRFQFANVPHSEVVIEYVSNKVGHGTLIDDGAIDVIRYGVHKQLAVHNASSSQAHTEMMKAEFLMALDKYAMQKTIPTVSEYLDHSYKYFKSSPKR